MSIFSKIFNRSIPSGEKLRIPPYIQASSHADGLVLLNPYTGQMFSANRVGSRIWQRLVERGDTDTLAESMSRDFGVDPSIVHRDMQRFITELENRGLAVRSSI